MNHSALFKAPERLRNCVVRKKVEFSTTLELYDEDTDEFLLACVYCPSMSPMLILVKMQDAHTRHFDELCCNLNLRQFIGKMIPDWVSGCNFKFAKFQGTEICEIRIKQQILISAPVSFTALLIDEDADEENSSTEDATEGKTLDKNTAGYSHILSSSSLRTSDGPKGPFNLANAFTTGGLFACIDDVISCTSASDNDPTPKTASTITSSASTASKRTLSSSGGILTPTGQYVEISRNLYDNSVHRVETKPPKWNTELRQYTQNYGGRVKIASQKNFIAVHSSNTGVLDQYFTSATMDQHFEAVCIRHGKVTHNSFILDYKFPISPALALAITAAVHVSQA